MQCVVEVVNRSLKADCTDFIMPTFVDRDLKQHDVVMKQRWSMARCPVK